MAQAEDTELRDLVIDALEKNGSLAKIRALLRANIFLAFEEECENLKQNDTLDKILQIPEGKYCLSIIHDFLEFCNLRNTLFVYKSETRQGKEYTYDNLNSIADKLNVKKINKEKEPMLLTLLRACLKSDLKINSKNNDKYVSSQNKAKNCHKDAQNSTYIVNEGSSTNTSQTQSDNSSDEKNKLDLRLTLDNSDTDTSSDSNRGQTSSEYIPNKHIASMNSKIRDGKNVMSEQSLHQLKSQNNYNFLMKNKRVNDGHPDSQIMNSSSTESTSYIELKPFNSIDTVLLNTPGLPFHEGKSDLKPRSPQNSNSSVSKIESLSVNNTISESKKDINHEESKESLKSSRKSDKYVDETEYSYDFTSPPVSGRKDSTDKQSIRLSQQEFISNKSDNISVENIHQNSSSSQSSISLSDVADLISDKSNRKNSNSYVSNHQKSWREKLNKSNIEYSKKLSDDSGDFSESPIPSLSNLSLDIHSD